MEYVILYFNGNYDQAEIDNAEWVIDPDSEKSNDHTYFAQWFEIYDWDKGEKGWGRGVILSQTLLNEDDKWEYILPKLGEVKKQFGTLSFIIEDGSGYATAVRPVTEYREVIGFSIYNEDGTEIASILGDLEYANREFNIIGGNIYMMGGSYKGYILYKYDPTTTSVKEVLRTNGKSAKISVNGRTIMVEAEDQKVDEAVVYDMGGRPMVSAKGRNRITLNASQLPEGLYSVATRNNGKTNGAQKIVIK